MLNLKRREGESIIIDKKITVTLKTINHDGTATIGIEAPKDILVDRKEVFNRKKAQKVL